MRSGALICSSALILAFTVNLRLNRCNATKEKDPTIWDLRLSQAEKEHGEYWIRELCLPIFIF